MITSKDRILDAAERVVLRDGAAHLTLDAAAAEAGLSKGGVLYHYRTKDDLIRAMIARLHLLFHAELDRLAAADPEPAGRLTRAILKAAQPRHPSEFCERSEQLAAGLLAAVAEKPSLLEPMRQTEGALHTALLDDGIDPVIATIVRLAADGLWMTELFGIRPVKPELRARVMARLEEMTRSV